MPLWQSALELHTPPTWDWFEQAPETDSQTPHDSAAAASLQQNTLPEWSPYCRPPQRPDRHVLLPEVYMLKVEQDDPDVNFCWQNVFDEYWRYSVDGSHVCWHW
jgi:hypothetical protein